MPTFRSSNPARPGEVVIELPSHTAADVDLAVQKAAEAQRAWAERPIPERAEAVAATGAVLTAK
jgi:acyl-CoA reductase-like NAD-dependent aldehyde dehydrogenase